MALSRIVTASPWPLPFGENRVAEIVAAVITGGTLSVMNLALSAA